MANKIKYENQVWAEGTPIAGERLSTNGHYTGEFKGTPMQDASVDGVQEAYYVENNTIRLGTMLGDAVEGSTPKIKTEEPVEA